MGAQFLARLTIFDGVLRANASSKCYFTSICVFLTITYNCCMRANFPTGDPRPAKDENVASIKRLWNVSCATAGAFCENCMVLRIMKHLRLPHTYHGINMCQFGWLGSTQNKTQLPLNALLVCKDYSHCVSSFTLLRSWTRSLLKT